jgi:hypothetical protein
MIFFVGIEGTSPSIARRQAWCRGVAIAVFCFSKTKPFLCCVVCHERVYSAKQQNAIYHQNVITAQNDKTRFINKTRFIIKSTKRVFQFISNFTFCRIGH